jgi:lipooligosaccharide transport system permease protein
MKMSTPPVMRVVEREFRVFARLWRGFVFSLFLNPVLYLAAMGLGLGGLVDKHSGNVEGLSYLQFVTPGLLVAVAMQVAAGESMWPVLGGVKWVKNFHATVATEITADEVLYGYVLWVAIRAMIGSVAFVIVAALVGGIPSAWGILAIPVAGLCAAAFCAPLASFSVMQDSDLSFPLIMRIGVLPLFLFSGTFYPISQLPGALQVVARFSPLYHAVQLARAATTGTFDLGPNLVSLAVLVGCTVAGLAWGRHRFEQRLTT